MNPENFDLSERELEILRLVATGVSNKEIALALNISPNTVKVHLRNVFTKIGAVSRTEATLIAIRMGLVEREAARLQPEPEPPASPPPAPAAPAPLTSAGPRPAPRWNLILLAVLAALVLVGLAAIASLALSRSGP